MPRAALTDLFLRSARSETQTDYWDTKTPAFGVRVGKHSKTFVAKIDNRRITIGTYPELSLQDARKKALGLKSEDAKPAAKRTFSDAYEAYKEALATRKAPGTNRLLLHFKLYDQRMLGWANTTQIVQLNGDAAPSDHDASLSIAAASIELTARRTSGIQFLSHIDILTHASTEAQEAVSPLSIPIPAIVHTMPSGQHATLKDFHVKPDFLFGLAYPSDFKFCVLEHDRSSEDMEPTKSLTRQSWLRKLLSYSAISERERGTPPIYETYLKVPSLLVLCLFQDEHRMQHAIRLAKKHARYPGQFLFQTIPPIDPLLDASSLPQLFNEPWQTVNGTFSLKEGR